MKHSSITNFERKSRIFIYSAAIILLVTGLAKVVSGLGSVKALAAEDPIVGVSFGNLMLAVGVVELVVAGICMFGRNTLLSLVTIAWLASTFAVYRMGLWWMGWVGLCSCLGSLTDALHLSAHAADRIMLWLLLYLLFGAYAFLALKWKPAKMKIATSTGNV